MKHLSFLLILLVLAVFFGNSTSAQGGTGFYVAKISSTNSGGQMIRGMDWQRFYAAGDNSKFII